MEAVFTPHGADLFGSDVHKNQDSVLGGRFLLPPFSVLNAREGWWQERKRAWSALGIQGELGRVDITENKGSAYTDQSKLNKYGRTSGQDLMRGDITENKGPAYVNAGTSIFDPVLCEITYRWFCPKGGDILDPFAGGSVRGIVASAMGLNYLGIEVRPEQCAANYDQRLTICQDGWPQPQWLNADSAMMDDKIPDYKCDLVFSCPPYADLERYSEDPRDLSTMDYESFKDAHADIIKKACFRLRDDRFAVWVVGDVRDKNGMYRGLPHDTVRAFRKCGLHLYNECVLVTAVGSLPVRTTKQFNASRKLGRTHQSVFIFVKGCPKKATVLI